MRQRSTRQKPLYLQRHLSMVGWDGEAMRTDPAKLDVPSWRSWKTTIDDGLTSLANRPEPPGVEHAT